MLQRLIILAILAGIASVFLISTDQRMLVWETKVVPGERYEVPGVGDVGKSKTYPFGFVLIHDRYSCSKS